MSWEVRLVVHLQLPALLVQKRTHVLAAQGLLPWFVVGFAGARQKVVRDEFALTNEVPDASYFILAVSFYEGERTDSIQTGNDAKGSI